jgi:hypothetical protein
MAKKVKFDTSFNFGANRKPRGKAKGKKGKGSRRGGKGGGS